MFVVKTLKSLRDAFYKYIVWHRYDIGKNFHCGRNVFLWARDGITIGCNFYIGRDSCIETNCIIGDNVMIANRVAIIGRNDHDYHCIGTPTRLAPQIRDSNYMGACTNQWTVIEDDVWIGYGSIILSGIRIGTGSIIAAGSVVTHDVSPYSVWAGVPARKIANRFSEKELIQHLQMIENVF